MTSDEELNRRMTIATAAFLQSNWSQAERLYGEVLKEEPTNPAIVAVGKTFRSLSLSYMGYKAADRDSARRWLHEALTLAREAVQGFQQTNESPQSAYRAIGMSICFMMAQEVIRDDEWPTFYPASISALKKAIELDPEDKEAHKHLASLNSVQNEAKLLGAKTGGCFIATASYGSMLAPEVVTFRQFRDDVLLYSSLGRTFVAFYCFVSPPLALTISKHERLRALTRCFVLKPLLYIINKGRK